MRRFVCIVYETAEGKPEAGLEHGAGWAEVPIDWQCPDRGGAKKRLLNRGNVIQNHRHGLPFQNID